MRKALADSYSGQSVAEAMLRVCAALKSQADHLTDEDQRGPQL